MKNSFYNLSNSNYIVSLRQTTQLISFTLFFIVLSHPLLAQYEKDTISISELISMLQVEQEEIEISNITIVFKEEDKKYATNKIFYSVFTINPKFKGVKKLYFYDCDFNTGSVAPLIFEGWDFKKMNMIGCESNTNLSFENCKQTGEYPLLFENNNIKNNLEFKESDSLCNIEINNCSFSNKLVFKTRLKKLVMNSCNLIADSLKFNNNVEGKTLYQLSINDQKADEIIIDNCVFNNNNIPNVYSIDLGGSEIDKVILLNNKMNTLNFSDTKVETSILIDSLFVSDYIGVQNFDFPESNTNIPWYNLGGEKLALFELSESEQIIPYQAKREEDLLNTLLYNDLISAYNKLNTIYHDRGDINSANKSYVEIKTLETRRQKQLLEANWDLNVYINYKLNVFLSFFSDYATNPGKSLIQSLWVLLIFSILYMFSFSDWDGMNYKYYLSQFTLFAKYVKNNKSVDEIYTYKINPHQDIMQEVKEKYLDAGKDIPRTLRVFGKPLHFLGKIRFEMMPKLIRLFNFQPKSWKSLNAGEKLYSGIIATLILISYAIYVLIVKFINAFILSLNSFVVIGFGMLPDRGLAMYLSIIEGIIGWFLLTIFTITLLSQVLQSA